MQKRGGIFWCYQCGFWRKADFIPLPYVKNLHALPNYYCNVRKNVPKVAQNILLLRMPIAPHILILQLLVAYFVSNALTHVKNYGAMRHLWKQCIHNFLLLRLRFVLILLHIWRGKNSRVQVQRCLWRKCSYVQRGIVSQNRFRAMQCLWIMLCKMSKFQHYHKHTHQSTATLQ